MLIAEKKKQQQKRLKTVHLGAFAKIVVCLVVNIFQPAPGERKRGQKTSVVGGKNVRRLSEMWNISDDESACRAVSHQLPAN